VENNWRTQWKNFETNFFFNPAWSGFEITLSELNQELAAFWKDRWNQRRHRRLPVSREEAWHRSIIERGGVVRVEPDTWDTVFVEAERTLDAAGCFNFRGAVYQVEGAKIWSCKVKVFCNIKDGSLVVQDQQDGRRHRAPLFTMQAWGEFKGSPQGELAALKKADAAAPKAAAPPTWRGESNVVTLPVRPAEVRESGFAMPGKEHRLEACATGPDLAAGVRAIEETPGGPDAEDPLEPTLNQYVILKIKAARGEPLAPREAAFLPWFEEACAGLLKDFRADVEMRVKLALVG
jgi:hypothetical protein